MIGLPDYRTAEGYMWWAVLTMAVAIPTVRDMVKRWYAGLPFLLEHAMIGAFASGVWWPAALPFYVLWWTILRYTDPPDV
ncbi:MAG TPA: hypothetical protein VIV12_13735 [Streptosporangiaceae bacterium]